LDPIRCIQFPCQFLADDRLEIFGDNGGDMECSTWEEILVPKFITAKELKRRMDSPEGVVILDVRASSAYQEWRIEGRNVHSLNIQNSKLKEFGVQSFSEIPKDKEIVTVCAKGISARETARMLEESGYQAVCLEGGMSAWSEFYESVTVVDTERLGIVQIIRLAKGCLSYMVTSKGEAAVVDAGRHIDRYIDLAKEQGVVIRHVLDTHLHADHISGGRALAEATGATYWIAEEEMADAFGWFEPLKDGTVIPLGDTSLRMVALKTPGHTVASTSFLVDGKYLLAGDTIFVSGLGRPDLKGRAREMANLLFDTVTGPIARLPGDLLVLPGHYSNFREINDDGFVGASLEEIRRNNPLLYATDREAFVETVVGNTGATPPNYDTVIRINRGVFNVSEDEKTELEIGPNRCAVKQ
jgi:glyoxylase-like metal-dependent hydrolase (beta-lactamase superfamily II)/rhodanese-related sulfurtransferase